jgi:hypothetical protein
MNDQNSIIALSPSEMGQEFPQGPVNLPQAAELLQVQLSSLTTAFFCVRAAIETLGKFILTIVCSFKYQVIALMEQQKRLLRRKENRPR